MRPTPDSQFVVDELLKADSDSQLSQVTLFTDQAWNKRIARRKAMPGLNRYHFELQAFHVDADSAQARVFGEGELLSVQFKAIPVKTHPNEQVQSLEQEKEKIGNEIKNLKSQKAVKEKQSTFLDGMLDFNQTELHKKIKTNFPTCQEIQDMIGLLGNQFQEFSDAILELEKSIKEKNKELTVIEQKLKQLKQPGKKQQNVIEVLFNSNKEQDISLEVSYTAGQASWEPVYKVEVEENLEQVKLTMFARIVQSTGENWSNVSLTISNAVPIKGMALPEPESWHVFIPAPPAPMGAAMFGAAAEPVEIAAGGMEEDFDGAVLEDLEETFEIPPAAAFRQATEKELPLAFEYNLSQPITHTSGAGDTLLPLFSKDLKGEFFVLCVPRKDSLAYMVCRAAQDQALLPGRLNVHFGGRYVGGSWLSDKKAGEDLLVNLGVDTGLKVKREMVTDSVSETFFGKVERSTKAREMVFTTTLDNMKDSGLEVHVIDSIPVSDTDRIQIKGVELTPEPTEWDFQEKEGVCKWIVNMQPKSVQKITCGFFVKHPKDIIPGGL